MVAVSLAARVQADDLPTDTNTITRLSPRAAAVLVAFTCSHEAATALEGLQAHIVHLKGLKSLDAETARALATHAAGDEGALVLNGLTTLSPEAAAAQAGFKGGWLQLSGLTTLSPEAATALAGFKGDGLSLDGLTTFSPEAATALAEYKGGLGFWETLRTKFAAHHPLAPDNAWAHAAVFRGRLSAITAFDSPDSVAIAEALATREGRLSLPNLKKISPQTLAALLKKADVEIPLIETLEIIPEPDGSPTDDFVIPKGFKERQLQQRAQ